MLSNVFEQPQKTTYSPPTDLMPKHYGKRASQMGFKLWQLKTQVWFHDKKHTKHNVLSPSLTSNTHSLHLLWSCGSQNRNESWCSLYVFLSSPCVFTVNCASLFCSLDRKIWKKPYIYLPIDPPIEEIRTEVVESGQKRRTKTPGVKGDVSASSTSDLIDQNAS